MRSFKSKATATFASGAGLLLRNEGFACRPDAGDLDDDLTILSPGVVWALRRFRIERPRGIGLQLAFIPFLAASEMEGAGQHRDRAHLIWMPMRHVFPARREFHPRDEHAGFGRVAV